MALRTDLPRISVKDEPTIWNQDMGKWAFWGSLIIGVPLMLAAMSNGYIPEDADFFRKIPKGEFFLTEAIGWGSAAIGGIFGGLVGKSRMEEEQQEGKIVREPTIWNKGLLTGLMVGGLITTLVAAPFVLAAGSTFGLFPLKALIVPLVTGVKFANQEKETMQREFDQAVNLKIEQDVSRGLSLQMSRSPVPGISQAQAPYVNSVSMQEANMLNSRMRSTDQPRSFVQEITARQQAMAQQQPGGLTPV